MNFIPTPSRNSIRMNTRSRKYSAVNYASPNLPAVNACPESFENINFAANQEIHVVCLRTESDIKKIAHLRKQIDLSALHRIDPKFEEKEKKKTKLVW